MQTRELDAHNDHHRRRCSDRRQSHRPSAKSAGWQDRFGTGAAVSPTTGGSGRTQRRISSARARQRGRHHPRHRVIRVVGHPKYPNSAGSPAAVAPFVARLRALPGHVFWKDDLSLIESDLVSVDQIMTPGQVTDAYLLALAVANKGQLATLDRRLSAKAVRRGKAALHIIGGGG